MSDVQLKMADLAHPAAAVDTPVRRPWDAWLRQSFGLSRLNVALSAFGFIFLVGLVDYLASYEFSFSVFYLLGIGMGTWFIGRPFGVILSGVSVLVWLAGDWASGVHYSTPLLPLWNASILMAFYLIVVWLLASLHDLQRDLEERVKQRTHALTLEMAERERLEKEIVDVSEREQRRLGRELHDSLCQHLTGTALAGQVLREKLEGKIPADPAEARKIVELVEQGIQMARGLSRGIYPVDMDAEGLMTAFQQLASQTSQWSKVKCVFEHDSPVLLEDSAAATQLYRIAREAVNNALRHAQAKQIVIVLTRQQNSINLLIEDDGIGLPEAWQKGLGARIMAHRAAMIGATFLMDLNPTGGTLVKCTLPVPPPSAPGK